MSLIISYTITRGKQAGAVCVPHKHKSGQYVVSKTRFRQDYKYVDSLEEVLTFLQAGYKVRVSDPTTKKSPSLVRLESLVISEQ